MEPSQADQPPSEAHRSDQGRSDRPGLDRRRLFGAAAGAAAAIGIAGSASAQRFNEGAGPVRYPDADIVKLSPKFNSGIGNTTIMRHHTGMLWAEGPAWHGAGRFLIWSDIPNDEALRLTEEDNKVSRRFRSPSGFSNGNTFDREGRQIAFRHFHRDVARYESNGTVTVLAAQGPDGRFNAPNDGVVHPADGSIWFTDPGYGSLIEYEGTRATTGSPRPYIKEAIYRIDASTGQIAKVADEAFKPNGLCFNPDYTKLYAADTGASHYKEAVNTIWQWDVQGTKLANPKKLVDLSLEGKIGGADGIRCDTQGNIWAAMGWVGDGYDGVHVFTPEGERIGLIKLPEICSNVCFGGSRRNRLFMTASQSLYSVFVEANGAHFC